MAETILVEDLMTRAPYTIAVTKTLADAKATMKRYKVRHLPVLDEGHLVGLVSDRDLKLVEAHSPSDCEDIPITEAMRRAPWTVTPSTPLESAARHMARHRLGSSVVLENNKVVGIFTSTDGLRALAELLAAGRSTKP